MLDGKRYCRDCYSENNKKLNIDKNLRLLNHIIPLSFKPWCYNEPKQEYLEKHGAFIWGGVGSGKSVLSIQIAVDMVKKGNGTVTRLCASEMMIDLRNFNNGNTQEKVDRIKKSDILIIDDLGSEKLSDFSYECLYEIINYRSEWQKKTIITSNKSLEDLDDRIASRVVGLCALINLDGEDLRLK